jgi:hypothetical protein
MAGKKISALIPVDLLTGDEFLPVVQAGVTKKVTAAELKTLAVSDLGTAAYEDVEYFATAAQGALADTALQPDTGVSSTTVATITSSETEPALKAIGDLWIDESVITIHEFVSDAAYGAEWNGIADMAPSKNAVYDKIQGMYTDLVSVANIDDVPIVGAISDPISSNWAYNHILTKHVSLNDIGVPGQLGFGVGVYPTTLPAGYSTLPGTNDTASDNYGNYQYNDGSVMCWIPAFYYRIGHVDNLTYATYLLNSIDIKSFDSFVNVAAANAAGYALHRAFYDGGTINLGFFVDKYLCSNNAGVASSIRNGNPLSTLSLHNPIGALTGEGITPTNSLGGCIDAAKTRGADFFCCSRFIHAALALLATAHGQSANGSAFCAWYLVNKNYPKGCNNNALADSDDITVTFQTDGYFTCNKTGSGNLFAKTTHNGQNSGVTDLNGTLWEVSLGITCVATATAVTGATKSNPCQVTVAGHGYTTGDIVLLSSIVGMTQLNNKLYQISVDGLDTFTLNGINSLSYTDFISGGLSTKGTFYSATPDVAMKTFTSGNTLTTDHWGSAGVSANMATLPLNFITGSGVNGVTQRYGSIANQVLSNAVSGNNWVLTGAGLTTSTGLSVAGTNLFGLDYYYQYIRDELCLTTGGHWGFTTSAGIWATDLYNYRTTASNNIGFRSAAYV